MEWQELEDSNDLDLDESYDSSDVDLTDSDAYVSLSDGEETTPSEQSSQSRTPSETELLSSSGSIIMDRSQEIMPPRKCLRRSLSMTSPTSGALPSSPKASSPIRSSSEDTKSTVSSANLPRSKLSRLLDRLSQ